MQACLNTMTRKSITDGIVEHLTDTGYQVNDHPFTDLQHSGGFVGRVSATLFDHNRINNKQAVKLNAMFTESLHFRDARLPVKLHTPSTVIFHRRQETADFITCVLCSVYLSQSPIMNRPHTVSYPYGILHIISPNNL